MSVVTSINDFESLSNRCYAHVSAADKVIDPLCMRRGKHAWGGYLYCWQHYRRATRYWEMLQTTPSVGDSEYVSALTYGASGRNTPSTVPSVPLPACCPFVSPPPPH